MVRVVTSSPWTEEDRALMLAWRTYELSLCSGCGHPKATAWHHQAGESSFTLDGEFICWGCTAAQAPDKDGNHQEPVKYPVVVETHDHESKPLLGPPQPQI